MSPHFPSTSYLLQTLRAMSHVLQKDSPPFVAAASKIYIDDEEGTGLIIPQSSAKMSSTVGKKEPSRLEDVEGSTSGSFQEEDGEEKDESAYHSDDPELSSRNIEPIGHDCDDFCNPEEIEVEAEKMNFHLDCIGGDAPNAATGDPWSKYIKTNVENAVIRDSNKPDYYSSAKVSLLKSEDLSFPFIVRPSYDSESYSSILGSDASGQPSSMIAHSYRPPPVCTLCGASGHRNSSCISEPYISVSMSLWKTLEGNVPNVSNRTHLQELSDCLIQLSQFHSSQEIMGFRQLLKTFRRLLGKGSRNFGISNIRPVYFAKVPIIKFTVADRFEVDLSFSNFLAINNTEMLNFYNQIDPRLRVLNIALKIVLKLHEGNEKPVINVGKWNVWYQNDMSMVHKLWKPPEKDVTVAELWFGFLRYYLFEFDREHYVVTIKQKSRLDRLGKLWESLLAVEGSTQSSFEFTLLYSFTPHYVHQGPVDPQPVEIFIFAPRFPEGGSFSVNGTSFNRAAANLPTPSNRSRTSHHYQQQQQQHRPQEMASVPSRRGGVGRRGAGASAGVPFGRGAENRGGVNRSHGRGQRRNP
ncbi:uridylyltransferase [Echinococcus granulosus]|uniref:Uridylyltransferase n=1 Tax=Echinococcus granulosus TaxID=6210 RepID=W6UYM1_ECHGR|nr:uridylyltransferase [Echinococcus granulosus]EUB58679.1 uridylyltransferase [Echinococcus granulosus]